MDQEKAATAPGAGHLHMQLNDMARYLREEIDAAKEKIGARKKLGEFLINVFTDEENRRTMLEDENARSEIVTLLTKYDKAEQVELDRFVSKFEIIEQMLIMTAMLIEKGKQGVDF